jgi:hypothetical protein
VKTKQDQPSVSIEAIRDAIAHRDLDFVLSAFFAGKPPRLKDAFRLESDCWDFKSGCPGHAEQAVWAGIAADVLAFYNTHGGILFFGIADKTYSFCGTKTAFDSKLFNDKIRRYCGDKFFVHYCKAFSEPSSRYLGVAMVPTDEPQLLATIVQHALGSAFKSHVERAGILYCTKATSKFDHMRICRYFLAFF